MQWKKWIGSVVILLVCAGVSQAQDLTVAAAADLQFAFPDVAARFQKDTGRTVKLIFGSSGNFYTQIQNGAPFDIFFSADISYPQKLDAAGLTEPGTLYAYATGKIVLWAPSSAKLDLSRGLPVLLDSSIKKIAIANPQHAPYGRAAVAALRHEGIYTQISDKLVLGENISQTATFVMSGGADVGIVALSLAMSPPMKEKGRYQEIRAADYPAIQQAAVILKSAPQKTLASQFLSYIKTPQIQELLQNCGFTVPKPTP